MGFVIILALWLYLLISLGVVTWAVSHAKKYGKSPKKWGWGAALVMYSIVFWDWIPTVAVHQYYCAKDSGFWVYKAPEQWKAENPGGEGLVEDRTTKSFRVGNDGSHSDTRSLNQHFNWITEKKHPIEFLPIYRWQDELVEKKSKKTVARRIDFSTGEGRDSLRFWMNISECKNGDSTLVELRQFVRSIVIVNQG